MNCQHDASGFMIGPVIPLCNKSCVKVMQYQCYMVRRDIQAHCPYIHGLFSGYMKHPDVYIYHGHGSLNQIMSNNMHTTSTAAKYPFFILS